MQNIGGSSRFLSQLRKAFRLGWWLIPLVACGAITIFFANQVLYGVKNEIASVNFGDGYTIRLWDEMDGIADPSWDPDHSSPDIFYTVTKSGKVVIPKGYLNTKTWDAPYHIKVVYAENGNLVCVYDIDHWDRGMFLIFDGAHLKAWDANPIITKYRLLWLDRYTHLKQADPDLPLYYVTATPPPA